jgi:hypothetical protein
MMARPINVEIARAYERLDSRVRVVVNEHNIGQFENRNRAAGRAGQPPEVSRLG